MKRYDPTNFWRLNPQKPEVIRFPVGQLLCHEFFGRRANALGFRVHFPDAEISPLTNSFDQTVVRARGHSKKRIA